MPIRSLVASALFAVVASLGCNFIMNPDGDGVFRCDNPDDCDVPLQDALADKRTQSRCAAAGGGGGGFTQSQDNKVCSVLDKEDVSCNPAPYANDDSVPVAKAYNDALDEGGAYSCAQELYGSAGCPPNGSTCNEGLELRTYETLSGDADNPEQTEARVCAPKGVAAVAGNSAVRGFDVLDQHCRSYFCDDAFVCNRGSGTSSGWRCVRCDPDKAYGNGGCGTMYLQGAPSTVYTADLGGDACDDVASADKTEFGPVVPAPVVGP
ncbi:hypothetical protein OV079_43930 [Nannocystis pusilla]|uniref:Lipoprotein n=1 Tax=Nannocystis pusilla TaxID=889268 RepID=A0A9X3J322_9BACT|nr:hypothetical protein [Nannocystis pusilla]MCY1012374.1 hypothetical protein [Nannocystis pusilla]